MGFDLEKLNSLELESNRQIGNRANYNISKELEEDAERLKQRKVDYDRWYARSTLKASEQEAFRL